MLTSIDYILLVVATLLFLSILASKASSRLGIPALLLFLGLGMLAGSEAVGGIYFDDAWVAQSFGVVALVLILFSGGLDTRWQSARRVLASGLALSTIGVLITAVLVGCFAATALGFSFAEGLLLGAIVSSTDAAAVFSVLRARNVGLKGEIKPLLEFESGSNDPMAVFLTIGVTGLLTSQTASVLELVPTFVQQMTFGAAIGFGMGKAMSFIVNRVRLEYEGLYPVMTLSLVLLTYGATAFVGGNGFLAVYIAALVLGTTDFIHKKSIMRFHDGLAWLMQIGMFLVLGLLVFPSRLLPVIGPGLLVSGFLMFAARPVSVFVSLMFYTMDLKEKLLVSWVGLRGAVPIILATFPLLAGVPTADLIFNIVFFIVLTSVLLQGTTIPIVARWLGVDAPPDERTMYPLEFVPTEGLRSVLEEVQIPRLSDVAGQQIVNVSFPKGALIILICRNREFMIPSGGTVLEAGDTMLVLADRASLKEVREKVDRRSDQPDTVAHK